MKTIITYDTIKDKPMLSRKETAFLLGCHANTLDRANIPHTKIGRRTVYSRQVLDSWIAENAKGGNSDAK